MSKNIEEDLRRTLEALRANGWKRQASADALGIPRTTLLNHISIMKRMAAEGADGWSGVEIQESPETVRRQAIKAGRVPDGSAATTGQQTPVLQFPRGRDKTAMEDEIRRLKSELRESHRDELAADRIRSAAFNLGSSEVTPPKWTLDLKKGSSGPGIPMTFWSDWHWGEVVSAEEMGGVNAYDTEIARKRVKALVERILDLTFHHMVDPKYPGIVIGLGGDMFSGEIHDELSQSNEGSILEGIIGLAEVLVWAIESIAKQFPEVLVVCVCGNHDRMTKRPMYKMAVTTSYAWLLYTFLEARMRDRGVKNVTFMIPKTFDAHVSVAGHRFLFTHGDRLGVKGGDGIIGPIGPIKRGVLRISEQFRNIGRAIDTVVMGHWHSYLTLPGIIVNGALKGYDDYAFGNRFAPAPPMQALWYVHSKHGITSHWPVYVEDAPVAEFSSGGWFSTGSAHP